MVIEKAKISLFRLSTFAVLPIHELRCQLCVNSILRFTHSRCPTCPVHASAMSSFNHSSFLPVDLVVALSKLQIKRAHFSALIRQQIERAMANLVSPDKNLSDAVDARSCLTNPSGCGIFTLLDSMPDLFVADFPAYNSFLLMFAATGEKSI